MPRSSPRAHLRGWRLRLMCWGGCSFLASCWVLCLWVICCSRLARLLLHVVLYCIGRVWICAGCISSACSEGLTDAFTMCAFMLCSRLRLPLLLLLARLPQLQPVLCFLPLHVAQGLIAAMYSMSATRCCLVDNMSDRCGCAASEASMSAVSLVSVRPGEQQARKQQEHATFTMLTQSVASSKECTRWRA